MRTLFRVEPKMPSTLYKTYEVSSPVATHWRPASCAEVECQAHQEGWRSVIDERTDLGAAQGYHIRRESGRGFTEAKNEAGLTVFTFTAGQRCFRAAEHRVRLARPELYVVREGDWRGNPRGTAPRRHGRAEHWVEDFGEHQERLADRYKQG